MDPRLTPAQIAGNCANPTGAIGHAVGEWMNAANVLLIKTAYARLQVNHGDRVLEIGSGNGAFVSDLVTNDNKVTYVGVDRSKTMIEAAQAGHPEMIATGRVEFVLAFAENIPFSDNSFERAVAINCVVFLNLPKALKELHRVLTSDGRLVVTSNSPETMANNPFAKPENGFRNLDLSKEVVRRHHVQAGFKVRAIEDYSEEAKRADGTPFVRRSYITIAHK